MSRKLILKFVLVGIFWGLNFGLAVAGEIPTNRGAETKFTLKPKGEFQSDSQQICSEENTKRGVLDKRMYDYCMELQVEGYEKLKQFQHQYADKSFYSEIAFPYCFGEWTKRGISNARMVAFCLNSEVEGFKDVVYFRGKYGEDKVNDIVRLALAQYKSWRMAAYTVKNNFK